MDYDIIACIINYGMTACRCKMGHHFTSACYNAIVDKKLCSNGGYGWLVVFELNDPLRQYFSLYRVVSQREGERKEKG